jgi:hypothetical protein
LKGTIDVGISFKPSPDTKTEIVGYSDADWGGDHQDRKSTTGYVLLLHGSPVSWSSRKQPTVALSSTEAEYMASTQATKEVIWLRRFLNDLGYSQEEPTLINEDNKGSIELAKNPVHHKRTKHIDIQHHFIREKVESGEIVLRHIPTGEMIADAMTKPIPKVKLEQVRRELNLSV